MGKLAHLMPKEGQVQIHRDVELLTALTKSLGSVAQLGGKTESICEGITDQVAESKRLQGDLKASRKGIEDAVDKAFKSLAEKVDKGLTQKDFVALQTRLVNALSNVQIPDYSEQLKRLEERVVDLQPVIDKIDSIEFPEYEHEERPNEWDFDIQRDPSGLIQSVTAKAK